MPPRFRILYAGPLLPSENVLHRFFALERLGQEVLQLNAEPYQDGGNRITRAIRHRLQLGPLVRAFNERVLADAIEYKPDIFWGNKAVLLLPETLVALRRRGIFTVDYTIDNAFGPRRDRVWRLYKKCIGEYDLHILQRDVTLDAYLRFGARAVYKMQTAFDPAYHFPAPPGWNDKDRDREVSFIGSPYDNRARFLTQLKREYGIPVTISGYPQWAAALDRDVADMYTGTALFDAKYREAIWRSKINLSFITHSNQDEYTHKTFEIAGCGAFQIAERSAGHMERFIEDEEIVLFSTLEECAEKIKRYLPDPEARERIAAASRRRAVASGYDNDTQLSRVLDHIEDLMRRHGSRLPLSEEHYTGPFPLYSFDQETL